MSGYYPNQQQGYPPPHSPQPGYGRYQQPPPPQRNQFPPQQGYGQPPPFQQGGYQQGGYQQPPPQGYPPQGPPQGFGQGGFAPPPGPPPGYPSQPPQQGYGAPPQGQYPPPQQQNYGPPAAPSPGYDPRMVAQGNATADANALRKAMKGFGTDEKVLIAILSKPDPLQIKLLRDTYSRELRRDLEKDVDSETSGYFRDTLVAIIRGPLLQDVHNVYNAIKGLGTKETMLNDVLIGRSNADMRAIKQLYQEKYRKSMESDVSGDLSLKTESLFKMVMSANRTEESSPIMPDQIAKDVHDLYSAMRGMGTDQITVCGILSSRSDGQLRAIAQQFEQRYKTTLVDKIRGDFSGHMQDALLLMVQRGTDRAMTDAIQLEETMAGPGTKDVLLVNRVVRVHWNRQHMDQVKRAYQHKYKRDLLQRIRGDTSGHYEATLVACLQ